MQGENEAKPSEHNICLSFAKLYLGVYSQIANMKYKRKISRDSG